MADDDTTVLSADEQKVWDSQTRDVADLPAVAGASEPAEPVQPSPRDGAAQPGAASVEAGKDKPAAATAEPADPDILELGSDGKPKNPGQWVRHGALHQERERRKALEKSLDDERAARAKDRELAARGDERLQLLTKAFEQPAAKAETVDADPEPDPQQDVFKWIEWNRRDKGRLLAQIQQVNTGVGEVRQQTAAERAETGAQQHYQTDALAFARANPDFGAAYQHIQKVRMEMLIDDGAKPEDVMALFQAEERALRDSALKLGKSPAALIYRKAQQLGYRKADAAAGTNGAAATNGNGAAAGNGTVLEKSPAQTAIDAINRGQDAGKSLSGAGGAAGDQLTAESLANMSQDEFNVLYDRISRGPAAEKQRLFGS